MLKLIVIGAGGHSRVVIDACFNLNQYIEGIVDINFKGNKYETILGNKILGGIDSLNNYDNKNNFGFIVAIGDNKERQKYFDICLNFGFAPVTIKHDSAIISSYAKIGEGTFVNAGAIINASAEIGNNVIINTGAIIDHESIVGDHSHIAPGAKLGGRVNVKRFCFVGIGSSVIQNITIEDNVIVGGGSVVIKNVEKESVVVGCPAKRIK